MPHTQIFGYFHNFVPPRRAVIALIVLLVNIKRSHRPTYVAVQAAAAGEPSGSAAEDAADSAAAQAGSGAEAPAGEDGANPPEGSGADKQE